VKLQASLIIRKKKKKNTLADAVATQIDWQMRVKEYDQGWLAFK